ncbi:unnamed protein product [Protopolystoma xenopodis]|uniref:Uncharacterized protein n=1 Tax=Protopolystoma xenopodis TaxID=117903 RepID=A0A448WYT0_9PLAT|nr:unnamed protein product [Protopolystoma xenopodis]
MNDYCAYVPIRVSAEFCGLLGHRKSKNVSMPRELGPAEHAQQSVVGSVAGSRSAWAKCPGQSHLDLLAGFVKSAAAACYLGQGGGVCLWGFCDSLAGSDFRGEVEKEEEGR